MTKSALLLSSALWMASSLCAAPILETTNYARFRNASDPNVSYPCSNTNGPVCSGSALAPGTNWTVNYFSSASASFGILRGTASVSVSGDNSLGTYDSFQSTGARAGFRDTYTITGGTGTGFLTFGFNVTGTSSQTPGNSGRPQFQIAPATGPWVDFPVINGRANLRVPITFGQPTELMVYFYALAQISRWESGASAFANYSNTAVLDQILVADANNQLLSTFNINSASGTTYTSNGVVPEPATIAISAAGLLLIWHRRNRSSKT